MSGSASWVELSGRAIRDSPGLFAQKPGFDSNAVMEWALWDGYLDADRVLPSGIPESAVMSFDWRDRIALPLIAPGLPRQMWVRGRWSQGSQRVRNVLVAFLESVPEKLALMTGPPVPDAYLLDIWRARHEGEVTYVHSLAQFRGLIQAWTEMGLTANVHAYTVLWRTRHFRADYGTAKKETDPFWSYKIGYDLRCCSENGYSVHWYSTEVEGLAWNGIRVRFVPLPCGWREGEGPSGCWDEISPVLA